MPVWPEKIAPVPLTVIAPEPLCSCARMPSPPAWMSPLWVTVMEPFATLSA